MLNFLVRNMIAKKLKPGTVKNHSVYGKYYNDAIAVLKEKGYATGKDGYIRKNK